MKNKIILTFDLDFWYSGKFLKKYLSKNKTLLEDFIEKPTKPILDLLNQYNQKATFFILGQVAEKYPELIKKISAFDHEIASHGYSHKPLCDLSEAELEKEIELSKNILKNIINKEIKGFRAPNFSINNKTKYAFKILEKYNFQYDSSVHPLSFYKINNPSSIVELPPSLGGIYFRILPLKLYFILIKILNKTKIPILYFHPYELFESPPKINFAPWYKRKIKYWGIKNAWKKFGKIIKNFNCISIKQYLDEGFTN